MKRYVPQPYTTKKYLIKDIDTMIIVEQTTRKEVFSYIDEYLDNLKYDWFHGEDDSFAILYSDGSSDYICADYDGHKIKRTGIVSMVYTNSSTDIVFGPYEINYYGVVTPSTTMEIDDNIQEVQ